MARPFKRGLSYFPVNTDWLNNRKIRRLLDKYGCEGATVYSAALCEIYAREGYFIPFSRNLCFDIAYLLHIDEVRVEEILSFCVKVELFDAKILEKHQALSSKGIQKRYLEVAKRLKRRGDTDVLTFEKAEDITGKTEVITGKIPPITEENRVIDGDKYTKGKGKGKGKEKKEILNKENLKINNFRNKTTYGTENEQFTSSDDDAKRRAELCRMREVATANQ
jgi:hypothetical protein